MNLILAALFINQRLERGQPCPREFALCEKNSRNRRSALLILTLTALFACTLLEIRAADAAGASRPNIVIIMADDMGFSDIGCYGGEIETPNLDRLAARGLRFTQFYNTSRCCPTRAALLTGLYSHQAGVGHMINNLGSPAYQGFLNDRCVTIAEVLRTNGYLTGMSGKWHVGEDRPHWPVDRGFDRSFALISGGTSYFKLDEGRKMAIEEQPYTPPAEGFYITDAITGSAVALVSGFARMGRPFFVYAAYTAPHWPLHALEKDVAKYKGKYRIGWDELRKRRHQRMIELGIVDPRWPMTPRDPEVPAWEDAKNKDDWERKMEVYAAQIDRMDQGIGKIVEQLRADGVLENTLIMFLADNGGCAEKVNRGSPGVRAGEKDSYLSYGPPWANASNTPFRLYKHWVHEGGISTPLIVHWPAVVKPSGMTHQPGHLVDLMATSLEVARAPYPRHYLGREILPLEGRSLLPIFQGKTREGHDAIYWEHEGNRAVRQGKWKLVAQFKREWELYDLEADRTELKNLAADHPEVVRHLLSKYESWVARSGVLPWEQIRPRTNLATAKINLLQSAKIFASHATPGDEFKIENSIDGDRETKWVGEAHPLSFQPANIVVQFNEPQNVHRLVLWSTIFRERLALKDVELYAWANTNWAGAPPLAVVRATNVSTTIDFQPVKTTRLRIRIRDTWREDHSYPRLHEIEVYRAGSNAPLAQLTDSLISGEKDSERIVLRRALGEKYVAPGTTFDEAKGYLSYVRAFLDTMIQDGTDRYGSVQSPMFASLLDMETHRIPDDIPANLEGQRYSDRSLRGGNLMHDIMLLRACDQLSQLTSETKYRQAVTDYLKFFLVHCPQPTGLFPWGEHAYWDFFEEKPGHATHEFLGGIPAAFWERLWQLSPPAVRAEADGLINHVSDLDSFHFDRHADLFAPMAQPRPRGLGGMDFPRHAGFYMHLWSFAYSKTNDQKYADWALKMIDHHWTARDANTGILPSTTRGSQAQTASVESTLSLAVSLLEAASLLPASELKDRFQKAGQEYASAVLRLPHRPSEGKFLASFSTQAGPNQQADYSEPYRYGYGGGFSADNAALLLAVHRAMADPRALQLAEQFADFYARNDPPPAHEIVRTHVYASIIGLFADLYSLRKNPSHLRQAERHSQLAIERLFHRGLFRGATSIDHYEGDLMVGNLAYNLLWVHVLKQNSDVRVPPNYFNR
jgi:arylsulfatase A-like enzyme